MQSITLIDNITFDVEKILIDITGRIYADSTFDMARFDREHQISLRKSDNWFTGVGSLYDRFAQRRIGTTDEFAEPCQKLAGTYINDVITTVENIGLAEGVLIGRIRIMRLPPKSCLTLHTDPDEFRYHIPLHTSYKCFFVSGTAVERMPIEGALYRFKTDTEHTAVNASWDSRTHMVFDTFPAKLNCSSTIH